MLSLFHGIKKQRCFVLLLYVVTCVCQKTFSQTFSNANIGALPALTNAKAQWVDFNNDGQLDLFIAGVTGPGSLRTSVLINNGNNTFNTIALPALADISFDFGDYNKDGFIDIVVSGTNSILERQTTIFTNTNGTGFTAANFALAQLARGGILWRDLDGDTDLDLIVTGLNSSLTEQSLLYEYKNSNYQVKISPLPALSNGLVKAIDVNSDGKFEILLTGLNASGSAVANVYSVDDSLQFELVNNSMDGSAFNDLAITDFNQDAFPDFVVAGFSGDELVTATNLYSNNGTSDFIKTNTSLINVSAASIRAGDLNTDGLSDILLTGHDDDGFNYTKYYRNNGGYSFTDVANTLAVIYNGDAVMGDYDNDGDLDIFQIGNSDISLQGNLFLSDHSSTVVNNAPTAPTNLLSDTDFENVTLSWTASTDDHTPPPQLTYNLYISSDLSGSSLVAAPLVNIANGFVRIPQDGNNGMATSKMIFNLPEGQYYWSVQAVDNSFRGSVFSSVQTFSICHRTSLGNDTTLCYNEVIEFEKGSVGDVVDWYSKTDGLLATDAFLGYTALKTDTLIVEITRPFGCAVKDTVIVNMSPLPTASLGDDKDICLGSETLLAITTNADSVNWLKYDNSLRLANNLQYTTTVNVKDTVIAQVFSFPHHCVNYDTIILRTLPLPSFTIGDNVEICYKESASVQVTGTWPTVNWRTLQSGFQKLASPFAQFQVLQKDTVIAQVIDDKQCVNYDSLVVNVLALPVINLGDDRSICYGENTLIQLPTNPYTLTWYDRDDELVASGVNEYSEHVTTKDTITVRAVDIKGCVNRDSIIIDVIPLPIFNVGLDTALCYKEDILLLTGSGFQEVDWFSKKENTILMDNSWFFNYEAEETDTLVAKVTSVEGCINYDSIRLEMLPLPIFSLGDDVSVCFRNPVQLSTPGDWSDVSWSTDNEISLGQGELLEFPMEQTLSVYAKVLHLNGCSNYDTIRVSNIPLPSFDLGLTQTYCAGDNVSISTANAGPTYVWSDGSGNSIPALPQYSFVAATSKMVRLQIVNTQGCIGRDSVLVEVNALPTFEIQGDATICAGEEASLSTNLTNFLTLEWRTDLQNVLSIDETSLIIPLFENARIFAQVMDVNECTHTDSIDIEVYALPLALAGRDTLLCFGENAMLGGDYENVSSLGFQWTPTNFLDDANNSHPTTAPLQSVEYALRVENQNGCVARDTVFVDVNPEIIIDPGEDIAICVGESIELGGSPTASGSRFSYFYDWSADKPGFASGASNPITQPAETTKYYVLVSTGRCEVFLDSVQVTVNPSPTVLVTDTYSIGAGGSMLLAASGADSYVWTPAETLSDSDTATPLASPLVTTIYTVKGTDVNGCDDTALVKVLVQNTLFIPSLFTPNNDGNNDSFKLFGSGIQEINLSIFDQAGTLLYSTTSLSEAFGSGWDGTFNGKAVKNDLYVWTIEGKFYNGEPIRYEGHSRGIFKLLK